MRRLFVAILVLSIATTTMILGCSCNDSKSSNNNYLWQILAIIFGSNRPCPRLAMWWPDSTNQSSYELAKYDYIGWGQ